MNLYLLALILYGLALIFLGFFLSRLVRSATDFFVAGRNLGPGLLFSTLLAANIGAGSTVGAASLGFQLGLSGWWWVGSAGIGSLILAFTVGPKIRELAARFDFLTVGDFLEERYSPSVRGLVAAILWLGTPFVLAGQLMAFSRILQVVAGTSKITGCLLGGVVVVAYFSASGLKGTAWINLTQLMVKGAGFLLAVPFALAAVGGWESIQGRITSGVSDTAYFEITGIGWQPILGYLILLIPSFIVSPGILQKIYGGNSARTVRLGVAANGVALLLFSFLPVILGMVAAAEFPAIAHEDLALPTVMVELLPFWLGAVLMAAVFSAEISSADAALFMLSTSLGKDLYMAFINPEVSQEKLLRLSRWISVVAGGLGVFLAISLTSVIAALTIFYSLLSVALLAPLLVGLYASRPGAKACLIAIVLSSAAALVFRLLTSGHGWGMLTPTAFGILISSLLMALALARGKADSSAHR